MPNRNITKSLISFPFNTSYFAGGVRYAGITPYSVDFSQVTDRQMIEASAASFLCDYAKMNELFAAITNPLQENTMTQTFME